MHSGLDQEKSQKWCLGLGPIYLENTTSGVLKTSCRKIQKIHPSKTTAKNPFAEVILLSKANFFKNQSKNFTK